MNARQKAALRGDRQQRCVAPLEDGRTLCPDAATTIRLVEGLRVHLCEAHARELDNDNSN